jgi:hypothetical protein
MASETRVQREDRLVSAESTYAESEARRVSCVCLIFLVRFFIKEKMNIEKRKQRSKLDKFGDHSKK